MNHNEKKDNSLIFLCSENKMISMALKYLCKSDSNAIVKFVSNVDKILCMLGKGVPDYIVIDIPPRECPFLVYTIRSQFPTLPVIFIQDFFLFSDRIVSEYFGYVWLQEYDTALCAYPDYSLLEIITHEAFSGTHSTGGIRKHDAETYISEEIIRGYLNEWLRIRLAGIVESSRSREVVINWLSEGVPLGDIRGKKKISDKMFYYHKDHVMKAVGIRHFSREFIPALSL